MARGGSAARSGPRHVPSARRRVPQSSRLRPSPRPSQLLRGPAAGAPLRAASRSAGGASGGSPPTDERVRGEGEGRISATSLASTTTTSVPPMDWGYGSCCHRRSCRTVQHPSGDVPHPA
jgi:hypothetical protein